MCSSIFLSPLWFEHLAKIDGQALFSQDFRVTGELTFQALRAFCKLSDITILDSRNQFYSNQYVSAFVIPQQLLNLQIESLTAKFRSSVTNTFSLSLAMIRDTAQANALFSGRRTNYSPELAANKINIFMRSISYGGCDCVISSTCSFGVSVIDSYFLIPVFNVPGIYTGCYVLESLLRSTLECFYSQACIDELTFPISAPASMTIVALDASLPTEYSVSSTIQELVYNLMIEEWNVSTMYERYHNEWQPTKCSYTVETKNDVVYIVWNSWWIDRDFETCCTKICHIRHLLDSKTKNKN